MFTGIVHRLGEIVSLPPTAQGSSRLRIAAAYDRATIATALRSPAAAFASRCRLGRRGRQDWFDVDRAAETLGMTTAKHWIAGTKLISTRLEDRRRTGRPYRRRTRRRHSPPSSSVTICPTWRGSNCEPRANWRAFIAAKGLGDADGVSLTVNTVQMWVFSVLIIPHTLNATRR